MAVVRPPAAGTTRIRGSRPPASKPAKAIERPSGDQAGRAALAKPSGSATARAPLPSWSATKTPDRSDFEREAGPESNRIVGPGSAAGWPGIRTTWRDAVAGPVGRPLADEGQEPAGPFGPELNQGRGRARRPGRREPARGGRALALAVEPGHAPRARLAVVAAIEGGEGRFAGPAAGPDLDGFEPGRPAQAPGLDRPAADGQAGLVGPGPARPAWRRGEGDEQGHRPPARLPGHRGLILPGGPGSG